MNPQRNKEDAERRWEATLVFEVGNGGDLDQAGSNEGRQKWMDRWWDEGGR